MAVLVYLTSGLRGVTAFVLLLGLSLLVSYQSVGQVTSTGLTCNCNEYIYLNEPGSQQVHKFKVESNGNLTEILVGGNPWYPGNYPASELPSPHGLGTDINGRLYIGETGVGGSFIRQFSTNGTITPTSTFNLYVDDTNQNTFSIGNTFYINANGGPKAYDLCTGQLIGQVCLNSSDGVPVTGQNLWGLTYNAKTEMVYASARGRGPGVSAAGNVWAFTKAQLEAALANGTCINPIIKEGPSATINVGEKFTPNSDGGVFGVVGDNQKNIYVVKSAIDGGTFSYILKYDAQGGFITQSQPSNITGAGSQGIGIIWSEDTNKLYMSNLTGDPTQDCISAFDANTLAYTGTAVPNPASGTGGSKALAIIKECCPSPAVVNIDQTFCGNNLNQQIFLQELLKCEGIIGEGSWSADPDNVGLAYDECSKSIKLTSTNACGKFILKNVGGTCGDFTINVNVSNVLVTAAVITGDQTVCANQGDPTPITVVSPATTPTNGPITLQWQKSTTSCTDGFTDIVGATGASYDPPAISQTTYYRIVATAKGICSTGTCSENSNCVTVTASIPPPINCYPTSVVKN
ncbi:hypothetical protein [Spirosoma fluviale]|uniref:Uncharacterized protein n=1 Tax=Spirosoma fluviale TaxID=1597977 RepID=A0A286G592_9BACT|nr:hypothetical protein [Spirosoma fluviale]SOD90663.1 hypothetical protein SAMN06269250_3498 [Spirosoma fluviale]